MERDLQLQILDRVMAHRAAGNTTDLAEGMYANRVDKYVREDRYATVQVFASSPFLGEIRHALDDGTRRHVAGMHDVDLTALGLSEIEERIRAATGA